MPTDLIDRIAAGQGDNAEVECESARTSLLLTLAWIVTDLNPGCKRVIDAAVQRMENADMTLAEIRDATILRTKETTNE